VEPHCSFCGTFTGPFSAVEGLFTVLICISCLEVRQAQPDTLPGLHDPSHLWEQWLSNRGLRAGVIGPWDLEWHTAAEHPGWTATYELLRPYPNLRMRVVFRRSRTRLADWLASTRTWPGEPASAVPAAAPKRPHAQCADSRPGPR
jgi:hypothetical protein